MSSKLTRVAHNIYVDGEDRIIMGKKISKTCMNCHKDFKVDDKYKFVKVCYKCKLKQEKEIKTSKCLIVEEALP